MDEIILPPDLIESIAKRRACYSRYNKSEKAHEAVRTYAQTPKGIAARKRYYYKHREEILRKKKLYRLKKKAEKENKEI